MRFIEHPLFFILISRLLPSFALWLFFFLVLSFVLRVLVYPFFFLFVIPPFLNQLLFGYTANGLRSSTIGQSPPFSLCFLPLV